MLTGIIPGKLKYIKGNAITPEAGGHRMIVHSVNDKGEWQDKISKSISEKWPRAEQEYKKWYLAQRYFKLGNILDISLKSDTMIVHMISQSEVDNEMCVLSDSLKECLSKVLDLAKYHGSSLHLNKFVEGDAWNTIEEILIDEIVKKGVNINVYEEKDDQDS